MGHAKMHEIQFFFCIFFLASTAMLTMFSENRYRPDRKLIQKKMCLAVKGTKIWVFLCPGQNEPLSMSFYENQAYLV